MENLMRNRLATTLKTLRSPQFLVMLGVASLLTTHPAAASTLDNGATTNGINTLLTQWGVPIFTSIAGVAWLVGATGHFFRPDKKEMFTTMTAVGTVGTVGGAGTMVVPNIIKAANPAAASGALIHGAIAHSAHVIQIAHVAQHLIH
jgi:hypothetical protein